MLIVIKQVFQLRHKVLIEISVVLSVFNVSLDQSQNVSADQFHLLLLM